jgi:hypothetical protein
MSDKSDISSRHDRARKPQRIRKMRQLTPKMITMHARITFIALLFFSVAAYAAPAVQTDAENPAKPLIYRCDSAKNSIRYQNRPCAAHESTRMIELLPAPAYVPPPADTKPARNTRSNKRGSVRSSRSGRSGRGRGTAQNNYAPALNGDSLPAPKRARRGRIKIEPMFADAGCPATREAAGLYTYGKSWMRAPGMDKRMKTDNGLREAMVHQRSLPSKTYLRNQGKWPAHCPQ